MIFGQRVRHARELQGMTQHDLASAIGVSQSTVAHIESDQRATSWDVLKAIAEATRVLPSFFERRPATDVSLGSLAYRARASVKAVDRDLALQYVRLNLEQIQTMAEELDLPAPTIQTAVGNPTKAVHVAKAVLGFTPDRPIPHLLSQLESTGIFIVALPLTLEKIDAFSTWVHVDVERPLIALSDGKTGDRLRFSVAHELGHIWMHRDSMKETATLENEADQFASEFLLPETSMRNTLTSSLNLGQAAKLKVRWNVSMQAIIRRAYNLEIITQRRYRYLFQQLSQLGWKKREPENLDVPIEKPRLFRKMVEMFYGERRQVELLAAAMDVTIDRADDMLMRYDWPRPDFSKTEHYSIHRSKPFHLN